MTPREHLNLSDTMSCMSDNLQRTVRRKLTRQLCVRLDAETRQLLDEMARTMGFKDISKMIRFLLLSRIREMLETLGRT